VLVSLSIRNFVLIADATLQLAPGLTVLSGETGAGKTVLTQALELLLGERAGEGLVGPAGNEARLEAVFELSPQQLAGISGDVTALADIQPGTLIAQRRLAASGRNRCFLNGSAVTLGTLSEALGPLLAFSGQHEHRRLLQPAYQREVLDLFGGPALLRLRERYEEARAQAREAAERLAAGERRSEERAREKQLLAFQVDELAAAGLSVTEETALDREQRLLSRAQEVRLLVQEAASLLRSDADQADATGLLSAARSRLASVADVDPTLEQVVADLTQAGDLLTEGRRTLGSFLDHLDLDPARLQVVEERLRVFHELGRKYGGSTQAAVTFLQTGGDRLAELEAAGQELEETRARFDHSTGEARGLARDLSAARSAAAPSLEHAIEEQLAALGLPGRMSIEVRSSDLGEPGDSAGTTPAAASSPDLGRHGADQVQFLLAPSAGLPARPLARTASGGELSRTLLAAKVALAGVEASETLVFDEIDAGIGGHTATAVGRLLAELARSNQVVAVTHLPQVAAFAQRHYLIEKTAQGESTVARLIALDEQQSLAELCRMMGGEPGDPGALAHARTLRDRATA